MKDYYLYRKAWRFKGLPHEEQPLSKAEIKSMLRQGGLMVRNTYDFDQVKESHFWYLVKDHHENLESLSSNTRHKVRKALESLDYQIVNKDYILKNDGLKHYKVSLEEHHTTSASDYIEDFLFWLKQDNTECWAIFDKASHDYAGFAINSISDRACDYKIFCVFPQYRHNAPYTFYGLIYRMNEYYLQEKGFRYVTDGSRSITEHSNIQGFLEEKYHFRKAYCQLKVYFRWWMGLAVKMLYPLRNCISSPSVKAILRMEEMSRN